MMGAAMKKLSVLAGAVAVLMAAVVPAAAIGVVEVKSPGGISAYLAEDHTSQVVAMTIGFKGGSALDPADKQGLSSLGASLMNEGAGDLDSFAFQSALEDRAITLQASADRDDLEVHLVATSPNLTEAMRLTRLALTQPRFDPEAVERMRRELLAGLAAQMETPGYLASKRIYKELFGDHPYAREEDGTPDSVKALTRKDVQTWARTRLTRDRLLIGVAGDVTPQQLAGILDTVFGGLPATSPVPATLPEAKVSTTPRTIHITRDLTQATIVIGAPGIARSDPDWYAASVADYIFGSGSFASRLMDEVREKRGLAYTVRSQLVPFDYGPVMFVSAGTRADQSSESLKVIREEWAKMTNPGVTADELQGAKQYLTGAWPLRFTSTGRIADLLLQIQRDKLGLDYLDKRNSLIEAVTLDDVRRVAKRLYDPNILTVVVVGPAMGDKATEDKAPKAKGTPAQ
jgi:zinc protease